MGKWFDVEETFAVGSALGKHKTKKEFIETAARFYEWALQRVHGTKDIEGGFEIFAMKCGDGCGGTRLRRPDLPSLQKQTNGGLVK